MAASLALRCAWVRIPFRTSVVHVQDFKIHPDLFDTTDVFALVGSLLGCGDQNAAAVTGDWSTNSDPRGEWNKFLKHVPRRKFS